MIYRKRAQKFYALGSFFDQMCKHRKLENYVGNGRAKKQHSEHDGGHKEKLLGASFGVMEFSFAAKSARKPAALALEQNNRAQ